MLCRGNFPADSGTNAIRNIFMRLSCFPICSIMNFPKRSILQSHPDAASDALISIQKRAGDAEGFRVARNPSILDIFKFILKERIDSSFCFLYQTKRI